MFLRTVVFDTLSIYFGHFIVLFDERKLSSLSSVHVFVSLINCFPLDLLLHLGVGMAHFVLVGVFGDYEVYLFLRKELWKLLMPRDNPQLPDYPDEPFLLDIIAQSQFIFQHLISGQIQAFKQCLQRYYRFLPPLQLFSYFINLPHVLLIGLHLNHVF